MSNKVQFSDVKLYKIVPGNPVSLSVVIGNTNPGGTSLLWQGEIIEQDQNQLQDLKIGKQGENLQGQILHCATTVKDTNSATNHTSVTYYLSNGAKNEEYKFELTASTNGGLVMYNITFVFT